MRDKTGSNLEILNYRPDINNSGDNSLQPSFSDAVATTEQIEEKVNSIATLNGFQNSKVLELFLKYKNVFNERPG